MPGTVGQPTLSRPLVITSPPYKGERPLSLTKRPAILSAVLSVTKNSLLHKEKKLLLGGVITRYMQALSMDYKGTSLIRNHHLHRTTIGP